MLGGFLQSNTLVHSQVQAQELFKPKTKLNHNI